MINIKKSSVSLLVKTLVVAMLLPTLSLDAQSKKATVTQKVSVKTPSAASKTLLVLDRTEINQLRYSYAIPFLKRYLKQSPPDSISLAMLGYCYKIQNRFDSAIYFYEKLDNLVMTNGNELPELYATVGNYESAIATYQKCLDNAADNTTTTYQLYLNRQNGFVNRKIFNRDSLDYTVNYLSQPTFFYSSTNQNGHFGKSKVIWSNGRISSIGNYVDESGEYGLTQFAYAIVDEIENLPNIKIALDSKKFKNLMELCAVGQLTVNHKVVAKFKKDFWKEFINE